jgi:hypothetical protein
MHAILFILYKYLRTRFLYENKFRSLRRITRNITLITFLKDSAVATTVCYEICSVINSP